MTSERGLSITSSVTVVLKKILEAMHFITRTHGEREVSITLSPVTNEELVEIIKTIKDSGAEVESFTLTDEVAVFELKIKQKDYATVVDTVLSFSKGLKVEIS